MGRLTLVLGGARSGKTRFAMNLASELAAQVVYVATAEIRDREMSARVLRHRSERPTSWRTLELARNLDSEIATAVESDDTVLIDCLSVWISNELLAHRDWPDHADPETYDLEAANEFEQLVLARAQRLLTWSADRAGETVVVSNEVGSGVVPAYPLGRLYRDILGRANQAVAAGSASVFLVVAGLGVDLRTVGRPN